MKSRTLPIFLAAAALVASTLACAFGQLSLSNARTALDSDGKQLTSTFSSNDTIYVIADLSNAPKGTVVTSKWYATNVDGMAANTLLDSSDYTTTDDSFTGTVYFYYPPSPSWPTGDYTVEMYLNGQITESVKYTVK